MDHKQVPVTQLRKMMLEELQRRNYSKDTIRHHLRAVEEFARYYGKPPDKLGLMELRTYQAYLLNERKLALGSVVNHVSGLRPRNYRPGGPSLILPDAATKNRLTDVLPARHRRSVFATHATRAQAPSILPSQPLPQPNPRGNPVASAFLPRSCFASGYQKSHQSS